MRVDICLWICSMHILVCEKHTCLALQVLIARITVLLLCGNDCNIRLMEEIYGSLSHYLQGFIRPRWCRISEPSTVAWQILADRALDKSSVWASLAWVLKTTPKTNSNTNLSQTTAMCISEQRMWGHLKWLWKMSKWGSDMIYSIGLYSTILKAVYREKYTGRM